ncbi:MAG: hypothetical protein IPI46_13435 [Bacteroidetes bacterium]|nr:hypothetical protein [Bacteroidota bacterium]
MICKTIDEVIANLDTIVHRCKLEQSSLGYFAVLYRKVTKRVKRGILLTEFEDNIRMEHLVVHFANRYFEAYDLYMQGKSSTQSWLIPFKACKQSGFIILQHLLAGINAHINLDLGIAALQAAGDKSLHSIEKDFNTINRILSEMVDEVERGISRVSPVFKLLMPLAGNHDEIFINFSINLARDGAWKFANELALSNNSAQLIQERDRCISVLATKLFSPATRLRWVLRTISWLEWRSVASNLSILEK